MNKLLQADLDEILLRAREDLDALSGQLLFMTGGTGFFGHWLLETLAHANVRLGLNIKVNVLSRAPEVLQSSAPHLFSDRAISFIQGDVRHFDLPQFQADLIIHGATTSARETFNKEDDLKKFETVALGTKRLLEFAKTAAPSRMLYLGSGACYGSQPEGIQRIDENFAGSPDPREPNAALGIAKRTAEFFCQYYGARYGLDISIARCFSFYGPYLPLDIHYAVGNFVADGLAGRPIVVQGDGAAIRSYLYAADLVVWLLAILVRGENLEAYNVGSEKAMTISELANRLADYFSVPVSVQGSSGVVSRYVPATQKARSALGLDEWTTLSTGLERMVGHVLGTSGIYRL